MENEVFAGARAGRLFCSRCGSSVECCLGCTDFQPVADLDAALRVPRPTPFTVNGKLQAVILALVIWAIIGAVLVLQGCALAPTTPREVDVPVATPIDCHKLDPGPLPDLGNLALLKPGDSAQHVLQTVQDALANLAQDDRRLRALMGQ